MKLLKFIPRVIFHVTNLEKSIRRQHHLNLNTPNAQWIWKISEAYFKGYNLSLSAGKDFVGLTNQLDRIDKELRGFAYEGAGTGLAILEILSPFHKKDLSIFLNQHAANHRETISAGIGLAYARINLGYEKKLNSVDSMTREFIVDGHSFYFGCLKNTQVSSLTPPKFYLDKDKAIFYRGIGRSLWFRTNGNINDTQKFINTFAADKKNQLWEGFAIACAYAGKLDSHKLNQYLAIQKQSHPSIHKGFQVALTARLRANIATDYTTMINHFGAAKLSKDSSDHYLQ